MASIRVALLQLASFGVDRDKNLRKAESVCRDAKAQGADIAVLPELWSIGYSGYEKDNAEAFRAWQERAVGSDSGYVSRLRTLARELDMAVVATYLEAWPHYPRNTAALIDRHGRLLGTYAKIHTCAFFHFETTMTPGEDFHVFDLDTRAGLIRTGLMICFDMEFPESARVLMLKGAEWILNPVCCPLDDKRHGQLQARARENAVCVASVNYPAPCQQGHSVAFDPEGNKVAEGPDTEAVVLAEFDVEAVRRYRTETIWGNAFRRPNRYGLLVSPAVQEPFVRKNGLGEPFDRSHAG